MLVEAVGNVIRFVLLPGQQHDFTSFHVLMAGIACLALIGDKGFDCTLASERLAGKGIEAVPFTRGNDRASSARSKLFVELPRGRKDR